MDFIIGIIAGIGTTLSFLPQVYQIVVYKETENISLGMFCIHTSGVGLWVVYGMLKRNFIIVSFNAISFILCTTILIHLLKDRLKQNEPNTVIEEI